MLPLCQVYNLQDREKIANLQTLFIHNLVVLTIQTLGRAKKVGVCLVPLNNRLMSLLKWNFISSKRKYAAPLQTWTASSIELGILPYLQAVRLERAASSIVHGGESLRVVKIAVN